MRKRNLFTFHSMYKLFIAQIGQQEKFLNTNDAQPFGIFLILCLPVYFITFMMNPYIKSFTLNTLMIFSNRSIGTIGNFTTIFLTAKAKFERGRK